MSDPRFKQISHKRTSSTRHKLPTLSPPPKLKCQPPSSPKKQQRPPPSSQNKLSFQLAKFKEQTKVERLPTQLVVPTLRDSLPPISSIQAPFALEVLPVELNLEIFNLIDLESLARFYNTCSSIQKYMQQRFPKIQRELVRRTRMIQYMLYVKYIIKNISLGLISEIKVITSLGKLSLKVYLSLSYETWSLTEEGVDDSNQHNSDDFGSNIPGSTPKNLPTNPFILSFYLSATENIDAVFKYISGVVLGFEIHTKYSAPNFSLRMLKKRWTVYGPNMAKLDFFMFDKMYNFKKLNEEMEDIRVYNNFNRFP